MRFMFLLILEDRFRSVPKRYVPKGYPSGFVDMVVRINYN
jgi:hypothetical protein